MSKILLYLLSFTLSANLLFAQSQLWSGKTDATGKYTVATAVNKDKGFILQAYILYKENWRPVKVFWNDKQIWLDMGAGFANLPVRVHYLLQ